MKAFAHDLFHLVVIAISLAEVFVLAVVLS